MGARSELGLGDLVVTRATVDQASLVLALRDDLARWMLERGIEQWRPGDLPLEWVGHCVTEGWVYLVSDGEELVGSVTIVWQDPLVWGERRESAGYVHMLMVNRGFAGRGIGRAVLEWAEGFILESGRDLARLDCARGNRALRGYYERAGYELVGSKCFPGIERAPETALYETALRA